MAKTDRAPMNHTLRLFSGRKPVQHHKDVIRRIDETSRLLKEFVSSATKAENGSQDADNR